MGHTSIHPKVDCEVWNTVRKSFPKEFIIPRLQWIVCPTFILKNTMYAVVYPIRNKSEVVTKFEEFRKEISTKTKIVTKRLRSDNDGELKNKKVSEL
jgi:hypothetical protein